MVSRDVINSVIHRVTYLTFFSFTLKQVNDKMQKYRFRDYSSWNLKSLNARTPLPVAWFKLSENIIKKCS